MKGNRQEAQRPRGANLSEAAKLTTAFGPTSWSRVLVPYSFRLRPVSSSRVPPHSRPGTSNSQFALRHLHLPARTLTSNFETAVFQNHEPSHLLALQWLSRCVKVRQTSQKKLPSNLDVKPSHAAPRPILCSMGSVGCSALDSIGLPPVLKHIILLAALRSGSGSFRSTRQGAPMHRPATCVFSAFPATRLSPKKGFTHCPKRSWNESTPCGRRLNLFRGRHAFFSRCQVWNLLMNR